MAHIQADDDDGSALTDLTDKDLPFALDSEPSTCDERSLCNDSRQSPEENLQHVGQPVGQSYAFPGKDSTSGQHQATASNEKLSASADNQANSTPKEVRNVTAPDGKAQDHIQPRKTKRDKRSALQKWPKLAKYPRVPLRRLRLPRARSVPDINRSTVNINHFYKAKRQVRMLPRPGQSLEDLMREININDPKLFLTPTVHLGQRVHEIPENHKTTDATPEGDNGLANDNAPEEEDREIPVHHDNQPSHTASNPMELEDAMRDLEIANNHWAGKGNITGGPLPCDCNWPRCVELRRAQGANIQPNGITQEQLHHAPDSAAESKTSAEDCTAYPYTRHECPNANNDDDPSEIRKQEAKDARGPRGSNANHTVKHNNNLVDCAIEEEPQDVDHPPDEGQAFDNTEPTKCLDNWVYCQILDRCYHCFLRRTKPKSADDPSEDSDSSKDQIQDQDI